MPMTFSSLGSNSKKGKRKRMLRDFEESEKRGSIDLVFFPSSKQQTKIKSKIDTGSNSDHRLVSSCSSTSTSVSCEESMSSNSSEPIFAEAMSSVTCPSMTRREREKVHTQNNQHKTIQIDSLSSNTHKFSKVKGRYDAPEIDVNLGLFWDESSWCVSNISSSTTKRNRKTYCKARKSSKVEGLMTATPNPSSLKDLENPMWRLRTFPFMKTSIDDYGPRIINSRQDNINSLPTEGSVQRQLWKRLNETNSQISMLPITCLNSPQLFNKNQYFKDRLSSMESPYVLYRWLRVRFAAGLVRSSFDYLHQILNECYDKVKAIVHYGEMSLIRKEQHSSLIILRDRLAGIWCVYAHFTLEVGCLAVKTKTKCYCRSRDKDVIYNNENGSTEADFNIPHELSETNINLENQELVENNQKEPSEISSNNESKVTYDDVSNHAISVLLAARDCPLVGNHTAIALSLGRMIVSCAVIRQSATECNQINLRKETISAKIKSAIDVCWDNIDVYRSMSFHQHKRRFVPKPLSKETINFLSNFESEKSQKLCKEKELNKNPFKGIESTLNLPKTLSDSLSLTSLSSQSHLIADPNTIRSLCNELNRWSRLGEELSINNQRAIRLKPYYEPVLKFHAEELPLFAPVESLSDPLQLYGDTCDASETILWQW